MNNYCAYLPEELKEKLVELYDQGVTNNQEVCDKLHITHSTLWRYKRMPEYAEVFKIANKHRKTMRYQPYSDKEKAFIADNYKTLSKSDMATELNRTKQGIIKYIKYNLRCK